MDDEDYALLQQFTEDFCLGEIMGNHSEIFCTFKELVHKVEKDPERIALWERDHKGDSGYGETPIQDLFFEESLFETKKGFDDIPKSILLSKNVKRNENNVYHTVGVQ